MNIDEMLPKVKEIELEILTVVDKFCRDNNLRYTLAYGTLLGAVRHKGFIPWDDDIDIWMPREDYDKFIMLWLANPVEGYIIQNPDLTPDFPQNFTKIRKDNTTFLQSEEEKRKKYHKGIFIDIFPLDRVSDNKVSQNMQKLYAVFMMLFTRGFVPKDESGAKKLISLFALKIIPKSKYKNIRKLLCKKIIRTAGDKNGYKFFGTMRATSNPPYSMNMFDKLDVVSFENKEFLITGIWDDVLSKTYGDYMKFPPVEERVWAHHPLLINLEHNYEDINKGSII